MDPTPKTRRETKKTAKEKKSSVYSQKHVRQQLNQRPAVKTAK